VNILLWVLQVLLALHTVMGALWKFSNSEQNVPSLRAMPHGVWLLLSGIELLCSVALLLPAFSKRLGVLAPIAALVIAAEMLLYCGLHLASGMTSHAEMVYWLVVAAICAFIAWGRLRSRRPGS
jgi:hypothetical protein